MKEELHQLMRDTVRQIAAPWAGFNKAFQGFSKRFRGVSRRFRGLKQGVAQD